MGIQVGANRLLRGDTVKDDDDQYTVFDSIVLGVIGGLMIWAALYLVYQVVVQS